MTSGMLPGDTGARLELLYGPFRPEVEARSAADPWLAEPLVVGGPAIRAEVVQAVEREWASTIADVVVRRLALGFDLDGARAAGRAAADVALARLGWDEGRVAADLADLEVELGEHVVPAFEA